MQGRHTVGQDRQKCKETSNLDVIRLARRQKSQETLYSDFSEILEMEQNAPCFFPHIL